MQQLNEEQMEEVKKRIHKSASFQRVFKGADGKLVLDEIDSMSSYNANTFDPDPYISAYKAGQRSIAIVIHNIINQDVKEAEKLIGKV